MPKVTLTDRSIRAFAPPDKGQIAYWDKTVPGFCLRISQGGTKTFVVTYGVNRQRKTIGRFPTLSLAEARTEAKKELARITLGKGRPVSTTYAAAVKIYLEHARQKNRPRTVQGYTRLLGRHFKFGRMQLADITSHDIAHRLQKLKNTPSEQNHAFVAARAFFRWAARNNYLEASPMAYMTMPARTKSRDHVLTDKEFGTLYSTALEFPYPYGPITTLLVLTGQRRGEIAALRWDWIDKEAKTITLPSEITKNGKAHTFPYGDAVENILAKVPETGDRLFPSSRSHVRGNKSIIFNGWGKSKKDLDATLVDVEPYILHDLRRTFSSTLAALGTPLHVTEKLLNHTTGTLSGVAAIYNRHSYMDEMRTAIEAYQEHVELLGSLSG